MIVLDTHIWIWWVHGDARLTENQLRSLQEHEAQGLGISVNFHRDPADQIIVATARTLDCPLLTADTRILSYPHVRKLT